jgi:hypothetical protein
VLRLAREHGPAGPDGPYPERLAVPLGRRSRRRDPRRTAPTV